MGLDIQDHLLILEKYHLLYNDLSLSSKYNRNLSRRYDTHTTIFSPEGRLFQVEYAMEAISHAGTCLGILASDGIVLAAERKNTNKLLDDSIFSEKIFKLNDNIACSVAGIAADANVLINELRIYAQQHYYWYSEHIPVEELVMDLCDLKQRYTQFGGQRPFGVSFLYMGWDPHFGFQLYQSDPSGNYGGWKATCIGSNHTAANSILKQDYKDTPTLSEALDLAIKVLSKSIDSAKLTPSKVEIATLTRTSEDAHGKTAIRILPSSNVEELIKKYEEKVAAEKKEKEREEKERAEREKQKKKEAAKS